jgi:predicted RNase H-like HicB family nuclease
METKILNYRIIIKPTKEGKKTVYLAECPTLGIYDWGDTIDNALKSIKEGIECHVESLIKDLEEIPVDYPEREFVTETKITVPINASLLSA